LVVNQLNKNCIDVISEDDPKNIYHRFLNKKIESQYIEILEIVKSSNELPQDSPTQRYFKKVLNFYKKLKRDEKGKFLEILGNDF